MIWVYVSLQSLHPVKRLGVDDKNVLRQVLNMWHFITKSFKNEAYVCFTVQEILKNQKKR